MRRTEKACTVVFRCPTFLRVTRSDHRQGLRRLTQQRPRASRLMSAAFLGLSGSPPTTRSISRRSRLSMPAIRRHSASWADAIARTRGGHPPAHRNRSRSSRRSSERGGAPARAVDGGEPARRSPYRRRSSPASRLDCLADRSSRCSRRSPRSSWPNSCPATSSCRSSPFSGLMPRTTTGTRSARAPCFDDDLEPRTVSLPPHAAASRRRSPNIRLDESVRGRHRRARQKSCQPTEFKPDCSPSSRRRITPAPAWRTAFGRWLEQLLGDRGLVVYDAADPASKPLASRCLLPRAGNAGADGAARRRGRRGPRRRAVTTPRCSRRTTRSPCSTSTGAGRPIRQAEWAVRDRRRRVCRRTAW